jgi:hypothetical protein
MAFGKLELSPRDTIHELFMTIISNSLAPNIPYDILTIILRNATLVPQIFDIPPYDYFSGDGILTTEEKIDAVKKSYPTKLAITQVCRAWRCIGLRYLYEALVVRSVEDLNLLSEMFAFQRQHNPNGKCGGEFTRRIDLLCNPARLAYQQEVKKELFSYLPNMSIWIETFFLDYCPTDCWMFPLYRYLAMLKYCSKSLRHLEFIWALSFKSPVEEYPVAFHSLIRQAQYLEAFHLWHI